LSTTSWQSSTLSGGGEAEQLPEYKKSPLPEAQHASGSTASTLVDYRSIPYQQAAQKPTYFTQKYH
jgi:hypothetical protein